MIPGNEYENYTMKKILICILLFCNAMAYSQTQADMNNDARISYQKADKELNNTYQNILIEYRTDSVFIKTLKASQRIWVSFRDAELKMKYPDREPGYYGSIQPMCVSNYLEQLTRERIKTLTVWLDGIEEGDGCAGSVKAKE